jgi:Fic family protein
MKENSFIHPVIRSIIIHFTLAYIHPFVDGNGRTARALFYWSMLRNGYWLTEFLSISRIIKKAPSRYAYSFLYTETDDNDLTYFIVHQLDVLHQAITEFREYAEKKVIETETAEELLNRNPKLNTLLNYRQVSLIRHALKHPGYVYSISEYQNSNGIVYETARKDLELLSVKLKLLKKTKSGKAFRYISPEDLKERLES